MVRLFDLFASFCRQDVMLTLDRNAVWASLLRRLRRQPDVDRVLKLRLAPFRHVLSGLRLSKENGPSQGNHGKAADTVHRLTHMRARDHALSPSSPSVKWSQQ